jgi:hypothetical protein
MIAPAPQIVALRLDVAMPSIFAVDGWSQRRGAAQSTLVELEVSPR